MMCDLMTMMMVMMMLKLMLCADVWLKIWESLTQALMSTQHRSSMKATQSSSVVHTSTVDRLSSGTSLSMDQHFTFVKVTACLGFYASAQRGVARGILFLSCSSMLAYVCSSQNIVNMISCRVFDTLSPNLHQRCIFGQRWTLQFGVRSRSPWNEVPSMLETALSGLVNTMSWKALVGFSPNLTPVMYCGTEMNTLNFGVKGHSSRSRWNIIAHCVCLCMCYRPSCCPAVWWAIYILSHVVWCGRVPVYSC